MLPKQWLLLKSSKAHTTVLHKLSYRQDSLEGDTCSGAQATTASSLQGASTPDMGELFARASSHSVTSLSGANSSCGGLSGTHGLLTRASAAAQSAVISAFSGGSGGLPPLGAGWERSRSGGDDGTSNPTLTANHNAGHALSGSGGGGSQQLGEALGSGVAPLSGGGARKKRTPGAAPNPFAAIRAGSGASTLSGASSGTTSLGMSGSESGRSRGARPGARRQRGPNPFAAPLGGGGGAEAPVVEEKPE